MDYLADYRNPCWLEEVDSSKPYSNHSHKQESHRVTGNRFLAREKLLAQAVAFRRLESMYRHRAEGGRQAWRIRCLPYLYLAGVTKSGTTGRSGLYFTKVEPGVRPGHIQPW